MYKCKDANYSNQGKINSRMTDEKNGEKKGKNCDQLMLKEID